MKQLSLIIFLLLILFSTGRAQFVPVGSGSYTTTFPGTDVAGRNSFPTGTPLTTGVAATKPAPTNDWWSAKIKNNHADNLFNYPFTLKTVNQGLVVTYIPWGVIDNITPVTVGVTGMNASVAKVSDFSDWTVTLDWNSAPHHFTATSGIGMPFLYFEKDQADEAAITVTSGTVAISNEMLIITDARNGADFVVYGPVGSVWTQSGSTYTSNLNGKNYWSLAFIPLTASSITAVANEYKKYAYVFPTNTTANWSYNEATSVVRTDFRVSTSVKEGTDTTLLLGLLPHQWSHLAADSPVPDKYTYASIRGPLKTLDGNAFSVENTFHGILPTLPYLDYYSPDFNPSLLNGKVNAIKNDQLATWTDSYNEGQVMNRLIQTARIADLMGDSAAVQTIVATIKERLEDWLTAESNERAFIFYYNSTWSALIGYPAGHGQDGNINDHHFHWGYFIHAASFMEQFEPGWMDQWGDMINLLVRDAASDDRNDPKFPFLRNFSPYAGHCWANGFASFPQGNDQESTSESMQFNSSLIHWGAISGNDSIRNLGIYLYTTEQSAVEEYWFDMNNRIFPPTQQYSLVSRVWGNSFDNGTFWTADIAASYGIEMYPIHGGSLYLGQDTTYVAQIWNELKQYTGILNNEANPNLWHDVVWEYLAFIDPELAITMYDSYPDRELKFGVSDAQTYHWLHSMNVMGRVDASLTANSPLAAAFVKNGETTYVAHNYSDSTTVVTFSDGYMLTVPAHSMATSKDIALKGVIASSFPAAYAGGSVDLTVAITGGTPTNLEIFDGQNLIGQIAQAPYVLKATSLTVGKHSFYAKIYDGTDFAISNFTEVIVGEQLPYFGEPNAIPGSIEAAHYDVFEGGKGQGIAYQDISPGNAGDFRAGEDVDATVVVGEGATVGWINAGEWLEYTVEVQQAGLYTFALRYASGNNAGGGPFFLQLNGDSISPAIPLTYTGNWTTWQTKTVNNIPLKSGRQVLRVHFANGEFNMGKMTFTYAAPLPYDQPIADAGANVLVVLPTDSTALNGTASSDPANAPLTYAWTQVYGPSQLVFSDPAIAQPEVSGLEEGVYLVKLKVDNGNYSDEDEVYLISSQTTNVAPKVSIVSPSNGAEFLEDDSVTISAYASDLYGNVTSVAFYAGTTLLGTATSLPYQITWGPAVGEYDLTAVATDNDGSSNTSPVVHITVNEAPSCLGTAFNGDFSYQFSAEDNNPTITFIPSAPGVGSPTCILYYGTNPGSLPGYNVTPNVPFRINATEGTLVYFYYTYSFPGGERNTSANKNNYVVGSCKLTSLTPDASDLEVSYYPNPVDHTLYLNLPAGQNIVKVFTLAGSRLAQFESSEQQASFDMSGFAAGVYFFEVQNGGKRKVFKVVK